jgi:hypothetical protein
MLIRYDHLGWRHDLRDEAIPIVAHGLDNLLAVTIIADRLTNQANTAGQGRFRDKFLGLQRLQKLGLGHGTVAMCHEIYQDIEGFGFQRYDRACTAQLPDVHIQFV